MQNGAAGSAGTILQGARYQWHLWRAVWLALLLMLAAVQGTARAQACQTGACVNAGPRLASVNSQQGPLLNLLLRALLPGSTVNLSVTDWNALAGSDVNLNLLLLQLRNQLGVSSTQQVLASNVSLNQLRLAMVQVAQADGNTALVSALNALNAPLGPLSGTVRLGELLRIDLPDGSLAGIHLDVLDLLTGSVQLYNYRNVLTTPTPILLDTAALGLTGVTRVQLWAQVVEPPVQVCGPTGSQFHTAAIRIKLDLGLLNRVPVQPLLNALNGLTLGLSNIQLTAGVLNVEVYANIARAQGTITGLNQINQAVNLQVQPGVVDLYIGRITDAVFFNRSQVLTPAIVQPMPATTLALTADLALAGFSLIKLEVDLSVRLRASAQGQPLAQPVNMLPAYPRTVTLACGTVCIGNLVTSLLGALEVSLVTQRVQGLVLGVVPVDLSVLTGTVNGIINALLGVLADVVRPVLSPVLSSVLGGVVDPLLGLLGVRVGEAVVTVEGFLSYCQTLLRLLLDVAPPTHPGRFDMSIAQAGSVLASAAAAASGAQIEVADAVHGQTYNMAAVASAGTVAAHFAPTWRCSDQNNVEYGQGAGDQFNLVVPTGTTSALTVTCVVTQRQRSANLAISKSNNLGAVSPGGTSNYVITINNPGPDAVVGATLTDNLPAGVTLRAPWTCSASAGSSCALATGGVVGTQAQINLQVNVAVGGQVVVTVPVTYSSNPADFN